MPLEQSYSNTGVWTVKDQRIFGPMLDGYSSVYFETSNSYLTFTGPVIGANDFTLETWYYPTELSATRAIFSVGTTDATGSFFLHTTANGTSFTVYGDGAVRANTFLSPATVLTTNTWHHIVLNKTGANTDVYLNGIKVVSGTSNFTPSNTSFQINRGYGGYTQSNISYFNNLRLVIGNALYSGDTITVPIAPQAIIGNTKLLICQSPDAFKDLSESNVAITTNGTVTRAVRVAPYLPHPYPNTGIISTKSVRNARMANTYPTFSKIESEILVVAGGGGGTAGGGGGGGAGGLLYYGRETPKTPNGNTIFLTPGVTYTATVGGGGAGGETAPAASGGASSFIGDGVSLTATGGGGGGRGSYSPAGAGNGGSGGGGGGGETYWNRTKGTGTSGQGFDGANGAFYTGGGGGGAGGAGSAGTDDQNVQGGAGGASLVYTIATGANGYYAGGGAAGTYSTNGTSTASFGAPGGAYSGGGSQGSVGGGGSSGGTEANTGAPNTYGAGVINTGGGGGGRTAGSTGQYGYAGGSGVVIIRTRQQAANTTGAPTMYSNNGLYSYVFTGTGTIRF